MTANSNDVALRRVWRVWRVRRVRRVWSAEAARTTSGVANLIQSPQRVSVAKSLGPVMRGCHSLPPSNDLKRDVLPGAGSTKLSSRHIAPGRLEVD
jgi:hypothetical protein